MEFVAENGQAAGEPIRGHEPGKPYVNELPITTLAVDRVTFPGRRASTPTVDNPERDIPLWQRWNDYGIGLLLKGKAELRQAAEAFAQVEAARALGRAAESGPRVQRRRAARRGGGRAAAGRRTTATSQAIRAGRGPGSAATSIASKAGLTRRFVNLRSVLEDRTPDMQQRGFDFSFDYEVINLLGQTLFDLGRLRARQGQHGRGATGLAGSGRHVREDARDRLRKRHRPLQPAAACMPNWATPSKPREHEQLHLRYKPDDNAQGRAERLARRTISGGQPRGRSGRDLSAAAARCAGARVDSPTAERCDRSLAEVRSESQRRHNRQSIRTIDPDTTRSATTRSSAWRCAGRWPCLSSCGGRRRRRRVLCFGRRRRPSRSQRNRRWPTSRSATTARASSPARAVHRHHRSRPAFDFVHANGANGDKLLPETMGGGCAFFDFDNDGDQDLLFVNCLRIGRGTNAADDGPAPTTHGPLSQRRQGQVRRRHRRLRPGRLAVRHGRRRRRLRQRRPRRRVHLGAWARTACSTTRATASFATSPKQAGVGGDDERLEHQLRLVRLRQRRRSRPVRLQLRRTGRANTTSARTFSSPAAAGRTAGRRTSRARFPISTATTATASSRDVAERGRRAGAQRRHRRAAGQVAGRGVRRRRRRRLDRHRRRQRHRAELPVSQPGRRHVPRDRRRQPASPST